MTRVTRYHGRIWFEAENEFSEYLTSYLKNYPEQESSLYSLRASFLGSFPLSVR